MADIARSRRVVGWTSAGLTVAVVAAGGFYIAESAAADNAINSHYRTATATTGSVTQQAALVGSVQRVDQASVGFPVSGQVATVAVSLGQHVTAGQTLATLDPTALAVDVVTANATLAGDQAQLANAQQGTTSSSTASGAASGSSAAPAETSATHVASGSATSDGGAANSSNSASARGTGSDPSAKSGTNLTALRSISSTLTKQVRTLEQANQAEQRSCEPFMSGHGPKPTSPGPTRSVSPVPSSTSSAPPRATATAPASSTLPTPSSTQTPQPSSTMSTSASSTTSSSPSSSGTASASATPSTVTSTVTETVTASPTASTDPKGLTACLADIRTLSDSMTTVNKTVTRLDQQLRTVSTGSPPSGSTGKVPTAASSSAPASGDSRSTGAASRSGSAGTVPTQSTKSPTTASGAASGGSTGGTGNRSTPSGNVQTGSSGSGSKGGTESVAQLQATVAQDQLALTQAKATQAQGTLVAPISGTVGSVGLTKGASATASDTVTIVGAGSAQVTVDATLAELPQLAAGQQAKVTVPGANGTVDGYVTNVGVLAGSDGTYPVTILVGSAPGALADGAQAQTYVTTKTVENVVTVPVSALQMVATGRATVTVILGGKATSQVVTVGAVGGGVAQVSGLKAGDTVAVANLQEALPGSSTSSSGSALTGGSSFGGGALGGGGGRRFGG